MAIRIVAGFHIGGRQASECKKNAGENCEFHFDWDWFKKYWPRGLCCGGLDFGCELGKDSRIVMMFRSMIIEMRRDHPSHISTPFALQTFSVTGYSAVTMTGVILR